MNVSIETPAKINRFLYILDRRPDGYHSILTMFEKVALFDTIEIDAEKADRGSKNSIAIDCPDWLPSGPENLVYKACEAFADAAEISIDVSAVIKKNIPVGGGLGGGSSDAAAALRAMNMVFAHVLEPEELHGIACRLGADVPFFLTDWTCALGTGIGDVLEPCNAGHNWYVLVFPGFQVSTRWAYENFKLTRKSDVTIFDRRRLLSGNLWQNDLEEPVYARYPELLSIKSSLMKAGACASLMSGSGSTVFGVFDSRERAAAGAASVTADTGMNCLVTRTLEG